MRFVKSGRRCLVAAALLALTFAVAAQAQKTSARDVETTRARNLYRLEIAVDAPPDFLYPYLIFEDKIARWQRDDSVVATFPNGIEPRIGKRIHVAVKAPTDPWLLMEIITLDRPREVRTRFIDGVLRGEFAYLLEPTTTGTRFVHEMRIEPVGVLTTIIWELLGKHLHRSKMKTFMANIKILVEADYQAEPGPKPGVPVRPLL